MHAVQSFSKWGYCAMWHIFHLSSPEGHLRHFGSRLIVAAALLLAFSAGCDTPPVKGPTQGSPPDASADAPASSEDEQAESIAPPQHVIAPFVSLAEKTTPWACVWNAASRIRDQPMSVCTLTVADCVESQLSKVIEAAATRRMLTYEDSRCREERNPVCAIKRLIVPCGKAPYDVPCPDAPPAKEDILDSVPGAELYVALCHKTEFECKLADKRYRPPADVLRVYNDKSCQPFRTIQRFWGVKGK